MKETQHARIYSFAKDGQWHCQTEFWAISKSPHKRRGEMSKSHKDFIKAHERFHIDHFEERKCQHDIQGAKDYRAVKNWLGTKEMEVAETVLKAINEGNQIPEGIRLISIMGNTVPIFAGKEKNKEVKETQDRLI